MSLMGWVSFNFFNLTTVNLVSVASRSAASSESTRLMCSISAMGLSPSVSLSGMFGGMNLLIRGAAAAAVRGGKI